MKFLSDMTIEIFRFYCQLYKIQPKEIDAAKWVIQ